MLLLWLASFRIELWPNALVLANPQLLVLAVVLQVPYALCRAWRLAPLLDVRIRQHSHESIARIPRSLLYGSGLLGFFVIIVLPLRLGEFTRPILLARARLPGVGFAEALGAVAAERVLDGLLVCAMLFAGLSFAAVHDTPGLGHVAHFGQIMLAVFLFAFVLLLLVARAPQHAGAFVGRLTAPLGRASERLASAFERLASTVAGLAGHRQSFTFLTATLVYWAITVTQLWLVLRACGIPLGITEAMVIVALVGLSIQLPGGPAQVGSFQLATSLALGLFLDDAGVRAAGSSFAAVMYALSLGGAAMLAIAGAALLAWQRK